MSIDMWISVLETSRARQLHRAAWEDKPGEAERLAGGGPICIWAPSTAEGVGKMVSAYLRAFHSEHLSPWFLLVALPNILGGIPPGMMDDAWLHPLTSDRWRAAIAEVRLSPGPVELLRDSAKGPMRSWNHLACITLALPGGWATPTLLPEHDKLRANPP